jgi:hypothetical protein
MCTHAHSWQGAAALHVFQNVADNRALDGILTSHVYIQPAMKGIQILFFFINTFLSGKKLKIWNSEMESHLSVDGIQI